MVSFVTLLCYIQSVCSDASHRLPVQFPQSRASLRESHVAEVCRCPQHLSNLKPLGCGISCIPQIATMSLYILCNCHALCTGCHGMCCHENEGSSHICLYKCACLCICLCTICLIVTATSLVVHEHNASVILSVSVLSHALIAIL